MQYPAYPQYPTYPQTQSVVPESFRTEVSSPVDTVSSPVDTVSSPVDTVSSPVDTVSSPVDMVSSPVDMVSSPVDMVSSPVDMVSSPVDTVHSDEDSDVDDPTDMSGVLRYLSSQTYETDTSKNEKNMIRRRAKNFVLDDGTLYYVQTNKPTGLTVRRQVKTNKDQRRQIIDQCHAVNVIGWGW